MNIGIKSRRPSYTLLIVGFFGSMSGSTPSQASVINLFDYAYNIDGALTVAPNLLGGVDDTNFNYATGLGSITIKFTNAGSHFAGLFVDHEIDEDTNTFFNETGTAVDTPMTGWSWEIDEPGFVFGDVLDHFTGSNATASLLDNTSGVPVGSPDDVSMALGWNFSLLTGESAMVSFTLSEAAPARGFYLGQFDADSNTTIYFSGGGMVNRPSSNVPENVNTGAALTSIAALGFLFRQWFKPKRSYRLLATSAGGQCDLAGQCFSGFSGRLVSNNIPNRLK
ncbi:MAG: hypothetical protein EOO09_21075 [Chitinophagaceae bacterium]|nr:MAG: hypothetical protein EOO09_21075 [Chitinophagaceae bacterium]